MLQVRNSMTARLILRLSLGLGLVWLVAVAAVGLTLREEIDELFDEALRENAQGLLLLAADGAAPPNGGPARRPGGGPGRGPGPPRG